MQNRRHFLKTSFSIAAAGLAGAAALTGARRTLAEEAPPETTSVRLLYWKDTCLAPTDILDDLLRDEGFADVRYVLGADSDIGTDRRRARRRGLRPGLAAATILKIDAGVPAVMLAGVHPACFELFARELIRSVVDLKGKTVGVPTRRTRAPTMSCSRSSPPASGSIRPRTSIGSLRADPKGASHRRQDRCVHGLSALGAGTARRGTGHVILNSAVDRPWSQYFCCMLVGNADFVRRNPIATKRVVRAMMRATDICAAKPDWVARRLVDRGLTPRYNYARQGLEDVFYRGWRDYDAEDAVRFWALRERELG